MKKVIYLSYYNNPNFNSEKRMCTLSAVNKMDYIISCLNAVGYNIDIISVSGATENNAYKGSRKKISSNNTLKLFASIGRNNIIKKLIDQIIIRIQLIFTFFSQIKRNSVVICYHSMGYARLLTFLKRVFKFKLVLEVEEIYADVIESNKARKVEDRLFSVADAYIFPTQMLNETINRSKKPFCIVHGRYHNEERKKNVLDKEKCHVVYAGTLDPRKGCIAAVDAAEYLNEKYHLHILGTGNQKELDYLKTEIEKITKKTKCMISYEGVKQGEEYIQFLQSCNIGLSPQDPAATFNSTSFPSKILSYLSNGLSVVSINIPAIRNSEIGDFITYFAQQTPGEIAEAIKNVDINKINDIPERLSYLDQKFKDEIQAIIEKME